MDRCSWCFSETHSDARVCPGCGAYRKKGRVIWKSPREVRRTDFVSALLIAGLFWALVAGGLVALTARRPTSTYTPTCSRLDPDWPLC